MYHFNKWSGNTKNNWLKVVRFYFVFIVYVAVICNTQVFAEETGVTSTTIKVGGVMDLSGDSKELGLGMKAGINAAINGEKIRNHTINFIALDDTYTPADTIKATQQLIEQGIFVMLGSVGTPTARVALPILAKNKVPAVGFFTGANLLRPGEGDIINFRASYVQEITKIIELALSAGVKPREVCAYVQNDAYGMAGVLGIKTVLMKQPEMTDITDKLEKILAMQGDNPMRNGIGPVGVYTRNANLARKGYLSLKQWEKANDTRCRLVVTVGTYVPIIQFIGYSRYKGDNWITSAVSFTGAEELAQGLKKNHGVTNGVFLTSVVPALDSPLPIVEEARKALKGKLDYVSLEGFIVGKMFLAIMHNIKGDITRDNFLQAVRGQTFNLGGLKLDFTQDNQGSDFVQFASFEDGKLESITSQQLIELLQE